MIFLNASEASWGLYQLIFVAAALLALYSAYAWYEARREHSPERVRRAKLLLLLAAVTMTATAFVSIAVTNKLPY